MTDLERLKLELNISPEDLGLADSMALDIKLTAFLDLADTLRPTATAEQKYQHAKAMTINAWIKVLGSEGVGKRRLDQIEVTKDFSAFMKLLRSDYQKALMESGILTLNRSFFNSIFMDNGI